MTLIDLEYGGPNYRGFDLGDFFCEFAGKYVCCIVCVFVTTINHIMGEGPWQIPLFVRNTVHRLLFLPREDNFTSAANSWYLNSREVFKFDC